MCKWAKEAPAGRSSAPVEATSESSPTSRSSSQIFIQPTPCLSNAQYSLCHSCRLCCHVVLFCFCVYVWKRKLGEKSSKSFLWSHIFSLTDRCGTMKANHNVPHTSKVPVFLRLLATTHNNLSPGVDSSKQGGKQLDETEAADKEARIQTARGR